jgi:hypothetical protein
MSSCFPCHGSGDPCKMMPSSSTGWFIAFYSPIELDVWCCMEVSKTGGLHPNHPFKSDFL